MLKLEDLSFRFSDQGAVQNYRFDLDVQAGEIAGLTGRSGSGKSTCLDLIAGFLDPSAGKARVNGADILHLAPGERPLTILFQSDNLFDHLSAFDNVALGVNPSLRLRRDESDAVRTALARVGLMDLASAPAHRLSGGEQQRVALARSLVRDRPVLLLDEPFSALDAETRADMLALVRAIVDEKNLAALMVTHDAADCDAVADRHYELFEDRETALSSVRLLRS